MKCQSCKVQTATWSWQPFGPDALGTTFTTPGSHYRGFPVVKVCESCKEAVLQNHPVNFSYQGNLYAYHNGVIANCTSRSGTSSPVRKADLIGHRFEADASIVNIDDDGSLILTHVQGWLDDGRCILFNGEVRIPLKEFKWIER